MHPHFGHTGFFAYPHFFLKNAVIFFYPYSTSNSIYSLYSIFIFYFSIFFLSFSCSFFCFSLSLFLYSAPSKTFFSISLITSDISSISTSIPFLPKVPFLFNLFLSFPLYKLIYLSFSLILLPISYIFFIFIISVHPPSILTSLIFLFIYPIPSFISSSFSLHSRVCCQFPSIYPQKWHFLYSFILG